MNLNEEKFVSFILSLRKAGIIDNDILHAVEVTPREIFLEKNYYLSYYKNEDLYKLNSLISAKPSDLLSFISLIIPNQKKRVNVLEIGTGTGWLTAILSHLFKRVYSIDCDRDKILRLKNIFKKYNYKNIYLKNSNGREGWPEVAPFNAIIVDAVSSSPPVNLRDQLDKNSFLAMPISSNNNIKISVFSHKEIIKIAGHIKASPLL